MSRWRVVTLVVAAMLLIAACGGLAPGVDQKSVLADPDSGKTDAQRETAYDDLRSQFDAQYRDWLARFVQERRDPRALPVQ